MRLTERPIVVCRGLPCQVNFHSAGRSFGCNPVTCDFVLNDGRCISAYLIADRREARIWRYREPWRMWNCGRTMTSGKRGANMFKDTTDGTTRRDLLRIGMAGAIARTLS